MNSYCLSDCCKNLGLTPNGTGIRKTKSLIAKLEIDTSHFDRGKKNRKYKQVMKVCPVCQSEFQVLEGHPKQSSTCSYSCSNTLFRSGERNGMYDTNAIHKTNYVAVCFKYHKKECVICGENRIVAVHHYNENHDDDRVENLVPLCPTHHQYWHSRYQHLIKERVDNYVKNFQV